MVKKLQKMAEKKAAAPAGLLDSHLAQTVKDSAQQIWLAGLGAFAKAQGEGGKVFDTLIKEGVNLQRKTQAVAEEKLGDVAGKMSAMAGEVGSKANAQWDKLESIFEERTARAMGKLGVPNAKALAALVDRVAALEASLAALKGESAPAAPKARARKASPAAAPAATPQPAVRAARKKAAAPAEAVAAAKPVIRRKRATQP
ncbi:MAG: phasin family protein [Aquabacterium sp.]|nr:phasin family protein [Aquabacterium sp.]